MSDTAITQGSADRTTTAAPGLLREDTNPIEPETDSLSTARSPEAGNTGLCGRPDTTSSTGISPGLLTDDSTKQLDSPIVVAEVDCLQVHGLGLTLPNGRRLLSEVSFDAHRGSLTAIIGPSGAGKSTLAKLVGGP
jgi:ABC-type glutathione transport system ATPase component